MKKRNAAEMKDIDTKEDEKMKGCNRFCWEEGKTRQGCYQFSALPRIPCYPPLRTPREGVSEVEAEAHP